MEYFKTTFESYLEYYRINEKKYQNINNVVDGELVDFYQIPFSLFQNESCIKGDDNYVLCFSKNFVYDYITDEEIKKSLLLNLNDIDISKDWASISSDTKFKFETAYTNKEKHTLRIAKLVQEIINGKKISPISIFFDERSYQYDIKNYVEDGNHRIRALQYLKYEYFPAYVYGNFSKYLIGYLNTIQ